MEGQPHDRDTRRSTDSATSTPSQRKKRPPPILTSEGLRPPGPALLAPLQPCSVSTSQSSLHRPSYSTTTKPSDTQYTETESPSPTIHYSKASQSQTNHLQPVPDFMNSTDSMHASQEFPNSPGPLFNAHSVSGNPEARDNLTFSTSQEDDEWIPLPECESPLKFPTQGPSHDRQRPEIRAVTQWRSTSI